MVYRGIARILFIAEGALRSCIRSCAHSGCCSACIAASAGLPPLSLDKAAGAQPLAGHMALLRDEQRSLNLADILTLDTTVAFATLPADLNAGFARHGAFWLHAALHVPAGQGGEWWLVIDAPSVEQLDAWITPAASDEVLWQRNTGTLQPLSSRDLDVSVMALRASLPEVITGSGYGPQVIAPSRCKPASGNCRSWPKRARVLKAYCWACTA